jgi:uncharacterized protein involved in exopolysaccharide biosynthesis
MIMDFKFYLSLFLRRLPWFAVLMAIGTALGLALASMLPPVYIAQARLLVESEQIPGNLAASTVQTQSTEQIQIIQQRILTRAALLELANRLQVYAPAPSQPARVMSADDTVTDMRERIRIVTTGGPSRRGPEEAVIVTVSFEAPTAAMAAQVTNELVTMILNEDVSLRTGVAGQTLDFFVQEVARLDKELAVRGAAILEFKQANKAALPDSLSFRLAQQSAAQERLQQLNRDESALTDRRATLVTLFERTGEVAAPAEALTPAEQQLMALRDQLSQALAIYAPQNPRVRLLEQQIAAQEVAVASQLAASGPAAAPDAPPLSPYDLQLADIDAQLKSITEQKADVAARLADLAITIDATPGNAITLETLDRDYASVRAQYDQAVSNRARAKTGDLIETLSKGQRISIIEQAVAPREPARPNRVAIASAGVGGGIVAGLGLVLLMELLNRSIRRPGELTRRLGITPFATLPYMRTKTEAARRRALIGLALALVLVGIPLGLWAMSRFYMPLDMVIERGIRTLGLTELLAQTRESLGQ